MSKDNAREKVRSNNNKIAQKLKEWRTNRQPRTTQSDIAEKIGLSPQTVQKLENGTLQLNAATIFQISIDYNVPLNVFFPIEEPISELSDEILEIEKMLTTCINRLINLRNTNLNELSKNAA